MAVSAEFRKSLARSKDAKARLTAAKKARPGGDFNAPDLPKGSYIVRVTAEAGQTSKNTLYARLNWMIMKGEHAKTSFYRDYYLEGDNAELTQKNWDGLSKNVQVLAGIGEEDLENFESWSTDDLCDVLDKIDSEAPIVRATLSPWQSKNGNRNMDLWCNALIEDIAAEELDVDPDDLEEEEEESEEEEAEGEAEEATLEALGEAADEGDEDALAKLTELAEAAGIDPDEYESWADLAAALPEEEEEEEEEEEAEEEVVISKDDKVFFKPKGKRTAVECKVLSANKAKEEATLCEVADAKKKYSNVPWADCDLVEEE